MVELGFRAGKMRFRFASYPPPVPFYVRATLNSLRASITLQKKMIFYLDFLICGIGISVRFIK